MTKQDYELIASILKFAERNDRFDYDRFIKATR